MSSNLNFSLKIPQKFVFTLVLLLAAAMSLTAQTSKRDQLTAEEIEIVRDTQELDKRTQVFIKAVERRLFVLNGNVAAAAANVKQSRKDESKWGALPEGTRAQLLSDIAQILEEAMNNIDVVYTRDEKNALVPKSVKLLGEAAQRFHSQLKMFNDKAASEAERDAAYQALRETENIIEAQKNLESGN